VALGPRKSPLDFGGNPDHGVRVRVRGGLEIRLRGATLSYSAPPDALVIVNNFAKTASLAEVCPLLSASLIITIRNKHS